MTREGDTLIDVAEIRRIFRLGRTATYELTHRPEFPEPVLISPRCYRWWASEVATFAAGLQQAPRRRARTTRSDRCGAADATVPRRITGAVRAVRGQGATS